MAVGHVALGAPGALRQYSLANNGKAYSRSPADPFAARINTSNKYGEPSDVYNDWSMDDWQAGVGRVDPEDGGYLWGDMLSLSKKQLILPVQWEYHPDYDLTGVAADWVNLPGDYKETITVGYGGYEKIAIAIPAFAYLDTYLSIWLYAKADKDVDIDVWLTEDNAGAPAAAPEYVGDRTVPAQTEEFRWYWFNMTMQNAGIGDNPCWLVISPSDSDDSIQIACSDSYTNAVTQEYVTGDGWSAITKYPFFLVYENNIGIRRSYGPVRFNGVLYKAIDRTIYEWDGGKWVEVDDTTAGAETINGMVVFDSKLYISHEATGVDYYTMTTAEVVSASGGDDAQGFLRWNGYLYRFDTTNVYYTSDGSTWSSAITVPKGEQISSIAGLGQDVYVATSEGLYMVAPGDFMMGVMPWRGRSNENGRYMVNHEGALYVTITDGILRIDPGGQALNIWFDKDDDLPTSALGSIEGLCSTPYGLCAIAATTNGVISAPVVLLYVSGAWHTLSVLPEDYVSVSPYYNYYKYRSAFYDYDTQRLWINTQTNRFLSIKLPKYAQNPYNDSGTDYQPFGWIETPKFYGGQVTLDKDWESVTISGENLATGQKVDVYWKDDASTDWESLGTIDANGEELRWSSYTTRPESKWIRIGLLASTTDEDETPKIEAINVKYLPYLKDRWRWQLGIELHDNQQLLDGTVQPSTADTASEQLTHLDSMVLRVAPLIFTDLTGTSYEVTITSAVLRPDEVEYYNSTKKVKWIYDLTLEQVTDGTYTV